MGLDKSMASRRPRRGRPLAGAERRDHSVMVRLSADELAEVDRRRGKFARGEWFRMAAFGAHAAAWTPKVGVVIPEINRVTWGKLSRSAANLNQIAKHLNEGEAVEVAEILAELAAFRDGLIGVGEVEDDGKDGDEG